jgi:hypothetical protein
MITLFIVLVSTTGITSNWMYFANTDLCEAARMTIVKEMETPRNSTAHITFSACFQNQAGRAE